MKWISAASGMSPDSPVIIVYRIDGTYELGYKGFYKYYSKNYKDIREGAMLQYWAPIHNPLLIQTVNHDPGNWNPLSSAPEAKPTIEQEDRE